MLVKFLLQSYYTQMYSQWVKFTVHSHALSVLWEWRKIVYGKLVTWLVHFRSEFYLMFWDLKISFLQHIFLYCYDLGVLLSFVILFVIILKMYSKFCASQNSLGIGHSYLVIKSSFMKNVFEVWTSNFEEYVPNTVMTDTNIKKWWTNT